MEFVSSNITLSPWESNLLSLTIYSLLVLILIAALLFLANWLGEKKPTPEKLIPYECGVLPTGTARFQYSIPFYLIAAFFLIFDVEVVYILTWAIAFRRLGWAGWCQITFFILILLMTLFYIWKKGGLEWKSTPER